MKMIDPSKGAQIQEETYQSFVQEKIWGPDDTYLSIPIQDVNVSDLDGWKDRDTVKVTVRVERINNEDS